MLCINTIYKPSSSTHCTALFHRTTCNSTHSQSAERKRVMHVSGQQPVVHVSHFLVLSLTCSLAKSPAALPCFGCTLPLLPVSLGRGALSPAAAVGGEPVSDAACRLSCCLMSMLSLFRLPVLLSGDLPVGDTTSSAGTSTARSLTLLDDVVRFRPLPFTLSSSYDS